MDLSIVGPLKPNINPPHLKTPGLSMQMAKTDWNQAATAPSATTEHTLELTTLNRNGTAHGNEDITKQGGAGRLY